MASEQIAFIEPDGEYCPYCEKKIVKPFVWVGRAYCEHCGKRVELNGWGEYD